ncbi:MAG: response regulator [Rhodothermales bacterium]
MTKLDAYRQQIDALHTAYVEQLPEKVARIEDLWSAACRGACSQEDLNQLYLLVHKLNGSGEAFGFEEITSATERIEAIIKNLLVHGAVPSEEEKVRVRIDLSMLKLLAVDAPRTTAERSVDDELPVLVTEDDIPAEDPHEAAPREYTILVVDDGAFLRAKVALSLRAAGFVVKEADDGRMAVQEAREHKPDLIVMDLVMPEMDGLEATRLIRKEPDLQEVPVIILTTRNTIIDVQNAFSYGINDYLVKPFKPEHLIERVAACLEKN